MSKLKILPFITTITLANCGRKCCKFKFNAKFASKFLEENQFMTQIDKQIFQSNVYDQQQKLHQAKQLKLIT